MRRFDGPQRRTEQLSARDRQRLEAARERLRAAITESRPLEEIESAEAELWQLREKFLGWPRPAWAPRASAVADWFSEEDSAYDELEASAPS